MVYRNDDGVEAVSKWISLLWLQGAVAQWGADGERYGGWKVGHQGHEQSPSGLRWPRVRRRVCGSGGRVLRVTIANQTCEMLLRSSRFIWQCAGSTTLGERGEN